MNHLVTAYSIYLPVMIALTIWVARTIHKNTRPFLIEIFPEHELVASAVNNLLQMGFYLIALGYGFLRMKMRYTPSWFDSYDTTKEAQFMTTQKELVEELAIKLGGFTLFIGFLLFFNLFLMLILRKSSRNTKVREQQRFQQYAQNLNKPQA